MPRFVLLCIFWIFWAHGDKRLGRVTVVTDAETSDWCVFQKPTLETDPKLNNRLSSYTVHDTVHSVVVYIVYWHHTNIIHLKTVDQKFLDVENSSGHNTLHKTKTKAKIPRWRKHTFLQKQQRTGVANLISYRGVYTVYMYIGAISRWLCFASATGDP